MAQIFNLKLKAGNPSKDNQIRIYIRVLCNGYDLKVPTSIKVNKNQFDGEKIIKTVSAKELNAQLDKEFDDLRKRLNDANYHNEEITPELIRGEQKVAHNFKDFVKKHIELHKGKFSEGRIRHLESNLNMLIEFDSDINFNKINIEYLQKYEKWLRSKRKSSTVLSKMSTFISFLNAAADKELFDKKKIVGYKRPKAITEIPIYLTESEIEAFKKVVESIGHEKKKNAGYYFLLSCYAGYRISDCGTFDYNERVKDNILTLRAKKNGEIVSIPIYPKLAEILKYCKENKFDNYEQDAREFVKEIAKDAGLKNWKDIKFHSGRHSFAMYCLSKGLSKDEVAELLGDSRSVVEVYARIINPQLHKSLMDRLG